MKPTTFESIGIVAGRGIYPILTAESAKRCGIKNLSIAAVQGDADPCLTSIADNIEWVYAGQIDKVIKFFRRQAVQNVIFAGQVKPSRLFTGLRPDFRALKLLATLRFRNAESIFSAVAQEFINEGIHVLPATTFLENSLVENGVIGKIKPGRRLWSDIAYGKRIACEISKLNIGQTVVIKNGTVLAVEGFEGTDKAVLRGGELGRGGITVVKVAKPRQDLRFDVPCIGLRTVQSLRTAKAKAIAVEARKTLLLEKEAIVHELNVAKISLIGVVVE